MSPRGGAPSTASDTLDKGDEVQRRYRYQTNYTALKALYLVVVSTEIRAVYCEKIEDILIEQSNGRFIGIQVKSRELDQGPFKASDTTIIATLSRFCRRDHQFPGWFTIFLIATNFVFDEGAGVRNLRNVLACARDNPNLDGLGPRDKFRKYFEKLSKESALTIDAVISTLAKVKLEERKTGIDQPDLELVHAIAQLDGYRHLRMDQLMAAASALRSIVWDASSLAASDTVLASHGITDDFEKVCQHLRDCKKRIDGDAIRSALDSASIGDSSNELLAISDYLARDHIPPGLGRMEFKMAAGAIPYSEIAQMKDDVSSLESAFLRWKERHGLDEANRRLAHFQYLASRDSRAAKARFEKSAGPYGQAMLAELRASTRRTQIAEQLTLFGCRAEHLLGAAGLLTEECKLWWGDPIPPAGTR
jgi:hypothetical protein